MRGMFLWSGDAERAKGVQEDAWGVYFLGEEGGQAP